MKFVLKGPVPYFPALVATVPYFPVSPKTYPADNIAESTVGHHGPYKIKTWIEDDYLILETNPDYYGLPPRSNQVTIALLSSFDAIFLALKQGEFDGWWRIPENMIEKFLDPDLKEKYVWRARTSPITVSTKVLKSKLLT